MKEFEELGLSYYESNALEILLKESLTPKELSKKSRIPLGKVYSVILSLEHKNLVKQSKTRPKKIYIENASSVIDVLISKKQDEHEQLLSNVRKMAAEIDLSKSQPTKFFEIGTTAEDNKSIQSRTFNEAQKEVCQILNINHKPKSNRTSKSLWEKEIENAIKRGVIFRTIYPENCEIPVQLGKLNKTMPEKFQIRRLNTTFARCDVIDNKKVLIKLVHQDPINFGGVLFIENEKLAINLKKIFEQMWGEAN